MGKVYLDNGNKLVVETNNGIIKPDGTASAEITSKEKYTISVADIALLLKIVNNQNVAYESSFCYVKNKWGYKCRILSDSDITHELEEKDNEIKVIQDGIKKLRDKISAFNQDRKIFWRPII